MDKTVPYVVLTTCPDGENAGRIAGILVTEHLAACVNIVPGIQSWYRWQGTVQSSQEHLLVIKTSSDRYERLEKRLQALHPYELPEIIAVSVADGLPAYLSWLFHPE